VEENYDADYDDEETSYGGCGDKAPYILDPGIESKELKLSQ
jgi:hypothetical protein